jgi:pyruvate kinase
VDVYRQHKDALWRVKESAKAKYPMRIVRVVRTVVFDGSKS